MWDLGGRGGTRWIFGTPGFPGTIYGEKGELGWDPNFGELLFLNWLELL